MKMFFSLICAVVFVFVFSMLIDSICQTSPVQTTAYAQIIRGSEDYEEPAADEGPGQLNITISYLVWLILGGGAVYFVFKGLKK